tara:strand:- start:44 stop:298 length:255 start_codon:yes stop_codon:yes gene_type:complete
MTDKDILKKQIIYRASYRGTKEMDILLGTFVKKYINKIDIKDLNNLIDLLSLEDEVIYNWYYGRKKVKKIPVNKISEMLKNFKL